MAVKTKPERRMARVALAMVEAAARLRVGRADAAERVSESGDGEVRREGWAPVMAKTARTRARRT